MHKTTAQYQQFTIPVPVDQSVTVQWGNWKR